MQRLRSHPLVRGRLVAPTPVLWNLSFNGDIDDVEEDGDDDVDDDCDGDGDDGGGDDDDDDDICWLTWSGG